MHLRVLPLCLLISIALASCSSDDDTWPTPARAVAAGGSGGCLLDANGEAWCWGPDAFLPGLSSSGGEDNHCLDPFVPAGTSMFDRCVVPHPVKVDAHGLRFVDIGANGQLIAAKTESGQIFAWPVWLKDDACLDRTSCPRVALTSGSLVITDFDVFSDGWCGLTAEGEGWCWSVNYGVQYRDSGGSRATAEPSPPTRIPGSHVFRSITTGAASEYLAIDADGAAWAGYFESAGDVYTTGRTLVPSTPVAFMAGTKLASARLANRYNVGAGEPHIRGNGCAVDIEGNGYCWGANATGLLGIGKVTSGKLAPVAISGPKNLALIEVGSSHACALTRDQEVYCWGASWGGELGAPAPEQCEASPCNPTPTKVGVNETSRLSLGINFTCVMNSGDTPVCWGSNHHGQLGNGTLTDSVRPTLVKH